MPENTMYDEAKHFFQVFEPKGEIIKAVRVPGSLQILGEISPFSAGGMLSANINKSAVIMAQKRKDGDRTLQFYSRRYDEKIRMTLNDPTSKDENGWANYMSSVLFMLEGVSKKINGMNIFIDNQISDMFDANSTEALEVGTAKIASHFSDWEINGIQIAEVCAEAEKKFMGREKIFVKYMPSILGKKDSLTYYNAAKKSDEVLKVNMEGYAFMTLSSGLKKKHIEEKRREIYAEVAEAIEIMKAAGAGFDTLDALTMEEFDEYRSKLSISQRKRAAFFISENERVETARKSLAGGKIGGLIEVINESQKNIKNRLEIVEEENEILTDLAADTDGVKAVRMLNLGVDGTVIAVVEKDKRKNIESKIKKTFLGRTGLDIYAEFFDLSNEMEEISINVSEFKK